MRWKPKPRWQVISIWGTRRRQFYTYLGARAARWEGEYIERCDGRPWKAAFVWSTMWGLYCLAAGAVFVTRREWLYVVLYVVVLGIHLWLAKGAWGRGHRRDREGNDRGTDQGSGAGERIAVNPSPSTIGEPEPGADPELVVPDASEAIVAYRSWEYRSTPAGAWLLGLAAEIAWPGLEKLEAKHVDRLGLMFRRAVLSGSGLSTAGPPPEGRCNAPKVGCSCGIYGLKTPDRWRGVFGEVSLWGRVIHGERGYRAQFAYPKRLWVTLPSIQPLRVALATVDEIDEAVRELMTVKANVVSDAYIEAFYKAKLVAAQLEQRYEVPVELHDPDEPHPLVDRLQEETTI